MGRAIITLSDDIDGTVEMNVTFEGGYNKQSHSHGQAALMIVHMDELAAAGDKIATEQAQGVVDSLKFPNIILEG